MPLNSHTLTRRLFTGGVGSLMAGGLAPMALGAMTQSTFVFIPGTWHGGWVWRPVVRELERRGHRAVAITCTGVGERAHLATPLVGLDTHIQDVVQTIRYEGLDNVTLVGHSFGGITATGVCDAVPEKIRHVTFFDAFIPTPARPAWVMRDASGDWPSWWEDRRQRFVDGYMMDFHSEYPLEMLVNPEQYPDIAALVRDRLTLHPAKQWTDPVSFANGGWQNHGRSYVHCTGQQFRQTSAAMYGPARDPGWDWYELPTQRLGMLIEPSTVADLMEVIAVSG